MMVIQLIMKKDAQRAKIFVDLYNKNENVEAIEYAKEIKVENNIVNLLTGEIIVEAGSIVTPEVRQTLLMNRVGLKL